MSGQSTKQNNIGSVCQVAFHLCTILPIQLYIPFVHFLLQSPTKISRTVMKRARVTMGHLALYHSSTKAANGMDLRHALINLLYIIKTHFSKSDRG